MITNIIEKMTDSNQRTKEKAEETITGPILTGGYFDYNLVAAFIFSDRSYSNVRMWINAKQIFCWFKLIEFMIETFESYTSKKQFPLDDAIDYTVEHLSNSKKEVWARA